MTGFAILKIKIVICSINIVIDSHLQRKLQEVSVTCGVYAITFSKAHNSAQARSEEMAVNRMKDGRRSMWNLCPYYRLPRWKEVLSAQLSSAVNEVTRSELGKCQFHVQVTSWTCCARETG